MASPFEQQEEILDVRFGLKTGFLAGAIFVMAAFLLTRFHLLSFYWLIIIAICWFFLWMLNLNTQSGKTIAKAHLTAQIFVVFSGMLLCVDVWQSLTLSLVAAGSFILGSALPPFRKKQKNE
jgi:hypothetical protein